LGLPRRNRQDSSARPPVTGISPPGTATRPWIWMCPEALQWLLQRFRRTTPSRMVPVAPIQPSGAYLRPSLCKGPTRENFRRAGLPRRVPLGLPRRNRQDSSARPPVPGTATRPWMCPEAPPWVPRGFRRTTPSRMVPVAPIQPSDTCFRPSLCKSPTREDFRRADLQWGLPLGLPRKNRQDSSARPPVIGTIPPATAPRPWMYPEAPQWVPRGFRRTTPLRMVPVAPIQPSGVCLRPSLCKSPTREGI
jgi:hypothetical protein